MEEAEKIARSMSFEQMHLTVYENNIDAINFYESIGWHRVNNKTGSGFCMIKKLSL
jgi:ribosomal protein S18 acetylase RimI-like enzyme